MEACIKDIKMWMAGNHLKLTDNKTEVITFTALSVQMNIPIDVIQIGDYSIPPVQCVRDLRVVFDQAHDDAWEHHQNGWFMLLSSTEHIVNPWFIDWWGYHTARLRICVIPNWLLQFASVWNTRICHHEVATCAKLGCPCRHTFVKVQQHNADAEEIALAAGELSHNSQGSAAYIRGTARLAPNYLNTLLQSYMPSRSLRSETGHFLIMPKARRKLGCHSLAYAGPKLWSELPVNIRTTTSIASFRSYTFFTNCCFYLIYNYIYFYCNFYFYMNVHLFYFHSL